MDDKLKIKQEIVDSELGNNPSEDNQQILEIKQKIVKVEPLTIEELQMYEIKQECFSVDEIMIETNINKFKSEEITDNDIKLEALKSEEIFIKDELSDGAEEQGSESEISDDRSIIDEEINVDNIKQEVGVADISDTPSEIVARARQVVDNLISQKSKAKYLTAYKKFIEWKISRNVNNLSEETLVTYFSELPETLKPSSLWATYSMLRSVINIKHKINIYNYSSLIAFLKQKNKGYKRTNSQALSAEQIFQFLEEAPDNKFLAIKVALIFGVLGACKRHELCNLTINDIQDKGDMLLVQITKTETEKPSSFVVKDNFYHIYKKYTVLRPGNAATSRFFLNYRNGKCTQQVIGINSFGSMPKVVAKYLNLKDPETYTGHTFRRTSATLLANSGVDLLTLKRHGRWKSNSVPELYVEESVSNKKSYGIITSKPSTSREKPLQTDTESLIHTTELPEEVHRNEQQNVEMKTFNFNNCPNLF